MIAIIGMSDATLKHVPTGCELWGMPWHEGYWRNFTRLFEMHDIRLLENETTCRPNGYIQRLKDADVPLYMQKPYFDNVTEYPFDSVPTQYFNSSVAYMMALAIAENPDEIGIYGVDMKSGDEFGYQKPNMEYLIGLAEGKGIKVTVPDESPLMKFNGDGIMFADFYPKYEGRYGWLGGN